MHGTNQLVRGSSSLAVPTNKLTGVAAWLVHNGANFFMNSHSNSKIDYRFQKKFILSTWIDQRYSFTSFLDKSDYDFKTYVAPLRCETHQLSLSQFSSKIELQHRPGKSFAIEKIFRLLFHHPIRSIEQSWRPE